MRSLEGYAKKGSPVLDAKLTQAGITIRHYVSKLVEKTEHALSFASCLIPPERNLRVRGSDEEEL